MAFYTLTFAHKQCLIQYPKAFHCTKASSEMEKRIPNYTRNSKFETPGKRKTWKQKNWIKVLRLKRKKTVMITNCNANYLYVRCLLKLYLLQKSSLAIIPSFKSYFIIPNKLNMFLIIFKIFWESLCTEYCPFKLCEAIKWK